MRLLTACLIFIFSINGYASPIWTYDISGTIRGPDHAASYLKDISSGDEFWMRMYVPHRKVGDHSVGLVGRIGSWLFSYNNGGGFYQAGDAAPERYTAVSGDDFGSPTGSYGQINGAKLLVGLLGFDESGNTYVPEEDRLVKMNGWIDPSRIRLGSIYLSFMASFEKGDITSWDEEILSGEIKSFVEVPEPNTLATIMLGLFCLMFPRYFYPSRYRAKPR